MASAYQDARSVKARVREAEVLRLRTMGLSFDAIAKQVGYANSSGAYLAFKRALQRTVQQPADEFRKLQLERLDRMLTALWPAIDAGKGYAVEKALMIEDRRARLLGLDAPTRTQVTVTDSMVAEIESLAAELGVQVDEKEPNR